MKIEINGKDFALGFMSGILTLILIVVGVFL